MKTIFRIIRKLLLSLLILVLVIVTTVSVLTYAYGDKAVQWLTEEAIQKLDIPVKLRRVRLSMFRSFPKVALVLQDVEVQSPATQPKAEWVRVQTVACSFDIWKLLHKQYVVEEIAFENGRVNIAAIAACVASPQENQKTEITVKGAMPAMALQLLKLKNIQVSYEQAQQAYHCDIKHLQANLAWAQAQLHVNVKSDGLVPHIRHHKREWHPNAPLSMQAALTYDEQRQQVVIDPTWIQHDKARITLQGTLGTQPQAPIQLTIKGTQISPAIGLDHLPDLQKHAWLVNALKDSTIEGDFKVGKPKGDQQAISLQGTLTMSPTTWSLASNIQPITLQRIVSQVRVPDVNDLKTASCQIDQLTGALSNSTAQASISVKNFLAPRVQCSAQSQLDLAGLPPLLSQQSISKVAGKITLSCQVKACVDALMQGKATEKDLQLACQLHAQDVLLKAAAAPLPCQNLHGTLLLKNRALTIKKLACQVGPSTFTLRGTIPKPISFLLKKSPQLHTHLQLAVDNLDVDKLMPPPNKEHTDSKSGNTSVPIGIGIPPPYTLALDYRINDVRYQQFHSQHIRGKLRLNHRKVALEKLQMDLAGGQLHLDSTVNVVPRGLDVSTKAKLQRIDVVQLLHTFKNFDQTFLTSEHIRGELTAESDLNVQVAPQGHVRWNTCQAMIDVALRNGALHNHPLMQQTAQHMSQQSLTHIQIPTLRKRFRIQDGTIHIPPIDMRAGDVHMRLSGTHTLDDKINYGLDIPLAGLKGVDEYLPPMLPKNILDDMQLRLKLQGTTRKYKVTYDTQDLRQRLKRKLKELQKEVANKLLKDKPNVKKWVEELNLDSLF